MTRRPEHAQSLVQEGLRVTGKRQRHARLAASSRVEQMGEADLIVVATKTFDVEPAVRRLAGYSPHALLLLVQNGLGCETAASRIGNWPILSGVTFMAGTRSSDTHVEYELDRPTWVAPWNGSSAGFEDAQAIAALLRESGLIAEAFQDLRPAQWSKLIFNSAINSVAAMTDLPFSELFIERKQYCSLGHLVYGMIREGKQVAAARGVCLHQDPWDMCLEASRESSKGTTGGRIPSMLVDVRNHQQTEIDSITGTVVSEARIAGVKVPISESIYRLVKALESSWLCAAQVRPEAPGLHYPGKPC